MCGFAPGSVDVEAPHLLHVLHRRGSQRSTSRALAALRAFSTRASTCTERLLPSASGTPSTCTCTRSSGHDGASRSQESARRPGRLPAAQGVGHCSPRGVVARRASGEQETRTGGAMAGRSSTGTSSTAWSTSTTSSVSSPSRPARDLPAPSFGAAIVERLPAALKNVDFVVDIAHRTRGPLILW